MGADCDDHGSGGKPGPGYGALEGRTARVLVLAGPERAGVAAGIARALAPRHLAEVFAPERPGLLVGLSAARAAQAFGPHLVHALGVDGAARAAGAVAAGVGAPLIQSLDGNDLAQHRRAALAAARRAAAVVVETEAEADTLRAAGVQRELYVTSSPDPEPGDADRFFLGAIEVVYGRVVYAAGVEIPEDAPSPKDVDGAPLVSIGGLGGRAPRGEG